MADPSSTVAQAQLFELSRSQKVFTLAGVMLGLMLAALDQTIVATAGPAIMTDLHMPASLYAWLTTSYLVASTVMVPVYGKLSDAFGRRRILVIGVLVFLVGSMLCGLSRGTLPLILSRAVQGLGAAALFTSAFAVAADIFAPAERGRYQGLFGSVFGLCSVVGPLAGGFLTDHLSWHWVFFINLPIGAVALFFILTRMPPLRRERRAVSVDYAGVLALLVFAVPLLLALSLGRGAEAPGEMGYPWGSPQVLGLLALSAVGLGAFVLAERRAKEPVMDLALFRNRTFAVGNAAAFVSGAVFLGAIVFLPLFMVNVVGLSATDSGFTLTPLSLGIVAGNVLSGQLVTRLGRYKPLLLGSQVLMVGAFGVMAFTLSTASTQSELTLKMVLVGLSLGPSIPLFTLAIQNAVPPRQIGVATSSATFFRQLGSTIGVALLGTVFGAALSTSMATHLAEATRQVPAEYRQQLLPRGLGTSATEEAGPRGRAFDTAAIKARLAEDFARQREQLLRAQREGDASAQGRLSGLERTQRAVEATVERVGLAFKQAFSEAIRDIYRITLLIALLALLVTLALPELPLRKRQEAPAAQRALE